MVFNFGRIKSYLLLLIFVCSFVSCDDQKTEKTGLLPDFCSSVHTTSADLESSLLPYVDSLKNKTGVYVLEDGGGSLIARAWLSQAAKQTIDVQYFIFSTDNVGLIACDYLVRAADRGVKVRILVDDLLVDAKLDEIIRLDMHSNISIKIYNPGVNLGKNIFQKAGKFVKDFRGANQRMHNKTFIVDGKVAVTGGRNMADEYFDYDHEYNFRDRDVLLIGGVVSTVRKSFLEYWEHSLSVPVYKLSDNKTSEIADSSGFYYKLHNYACDPENFWPQIRQRINDLPKAFEEIVASPGFQWVDSVGFVYDIPGKNKGKQGLRGGGVTTDSLVALLKSARNTIDIQTPYLVMTEEGRMLFAELIKKGVKVRILTNSLASTDNLEAFSGYQRDRQKLLKTGIRIFEFRPDAKERYKVMTGDLQKKLNYIPVFGLHAKSMVIDGNVTVIGTFNLDPRSANLNTECFTVINSKPVSSLVLHGMETEFSQENSWETTMSFNPDKIAGAKKRISSYSRKVIPKNIL